MYASILNITFDCHDARAQAEFWAAVTGWTAHERDATAGHVEYAVEPPSAGTPRLYFTTVPGATRQSQEPGHPRLRRGCPAGVQDLVAAVQPGVRISAALLRPGPRPSEAGVAPR